MIITKDPVFTNLLDEYKRTNNINTSRIRQDLQKEQSISRDYKGREIYELIQNAEDAESDFVEIKLDSKSQSLTVANGGKSCMPFSVAGFSSIMMADMSPKQMSGRTFIGCKGLGFRSLINWAEEINITSDGVKCSFSRIIAQKYWNIIKNSMDVSLAQQHEDFAKKVKVSCPVAMLSIPDVDACNSTNYVTSIEVKFKKGCLCDIKNQLNNLSGKVLLFLRNLKKISITIDGVPHNIVKTDVITQQSSSRSQITITDKKHKDGQVWEVYNISKNCEHDNNKKYEISVAYDKESKESGEYIYTFFPTNIRLSLPCVVHATFDLDSSRNHINRSEDNDIIQEEIACILKDFAEELAKEDYKKNNETKWDFFEILNMKEKNEQKDLPLLYKKLESLKKTTCLYPTIHDGYKTLSETVYYADSIAEFIYSYYNDVCLNDELKNHLIRNYENYGVLSMNYDSYFHYSINNISENIQKLSSKNSDRTYVRAHLIAAICDVQNCEPMTILIDTNYGLINERNTAYMNVGANIPNLPINMGIYCINNELIAHLLTLLNIKDSNKYRGLTSRLSNNNCVKVSDLDINAVKKKIVSYSNKDMTDIDFKQLMQALYNYTKKLPNCDEFSKVFKHPDFRVFRNDLEKCYPSEVVLWDNGDQNGKYVDCFKLYGSLTDWQKWLSNNASVNEPECDVRRFFIDIIGVSEFVPAKYIPFTDLVDNYITTHASYCKNNPSRYYSVNIESKDTFDFYNRVYVVDKAFIDYYSKFNNLLNFIELLCKDKRIIKSLEDTAIYYFYSSIKQEGVFISYPLYELRNNVIFSDIQSYVVAEKMLLSVNNEFENQLNEIAETEDGRKMLLLLGAKERLTDVDIVGLYKALYDLPNKDLKKGVQGLYKSIREAIVQNKGKDKENFDNESNGFAKNGYVYARKKGGVIETKPVNEVYYWDNDQLPRQILAQRHKLEIGNRVGEDSVKEIFGVKLAKEISFKIGNNTINSSLEHELEKWINDRIRFIIAYRIHASRDIRDKKTIHTFANKLKDLCIHIYKSCEFSCNEDTKYEPLNEGEMIITNEDGRLIFHICCTRYNLSNILREFPAFCEDLTEAICIVLKVASSEMANCFRSILKNSIEENIFISQKEITDEQEWIDTENALGISNDEKGFWIKVDNDIDINQLLQGNKKKTKYLKDYFKGKGVDIYLPDYFTNVADISPSEQYKLLLSLKLSNYDASILSKEGLYKYYIEAMIGKCQDYKDSFAHWVYDNIGKISSNKSELPYEYYDICQKFSNNVWYEEQVREISKKILSDIELENKFKEFFKESFNYSNVENALNYEPLNIRPKQQYIDILRKYNLNESNIDQKDLSLSYFDGYESKFEELVKSQNHVAENDSKIDQTQEVGYTIKKGIGINKEDFTKSEEKENVKKTKSGGRYQSDREKFKAGLDAEKAVFNKLKEDSETYPKVIGCSRNLDPINGNDSLHYDIKYCVKDSEGNIGHERFLEVKSMSGDSIFMSNEEYEFAKDNNNTEFYDFAIVKGKEITIIEHPFVNKGNVSKLTAIPDTYKITMNIENIEDKELQ